MNELFSLTDRVAIVTGAGDGIGRAIALALSEAGADIVTAEIRPEAMAATAKEIRSKGRKALECVVDAQNRSQVEGMVEKTLTEFGKINILVNDVGGPAGFGAEPFSEASDQHWEAVFNLNVKSAFFCSRAVGKTMLERKLSGSIINIGSLVGISTCGGRVYYGAAKGAIHSFTHGLGCEWAPYGIRVNCIAPININTPARIMFYTEHPELEGRRNRMIPMERPGTPEEVAAVAVFLASDASSYITGQIIQVTGGLDTMLSGGRDI